MRGFGRIGERIRSPQHRERTIVVSRLTILPFTRGLASAAALDREAVGLFLGVIRYLSPFSAV